MTLSFFKKILIFFIPLIIIITGFEIYLRKIPTSYQLKKEGLIENAADIELLILGSSHAAYDINPEKLTIMNAYNMAQVNQSLYVDKRLTLKYLDSLKKLKVVLISIDFTSLYFSSQDMRDNWVYYYYGINYKNSLPALIRYSYLTGFSPKVAISLIKKSLNEKYAIIKAVDLENDVAINVPMQKGFNYYTTTDSTVMNELDYKYRADEFNSIDKKSTEREEIITDLKDFISILKARGITPVIITPPCYSEFNQLLDTHYMQQNKTDIKNLADTFSLTYWDYLNLPIGKDGYYNCDHLNIKGADLFTAKLNEDLIQKFGTDSTNTLHQ